VAGGVARAAYQVGVLKAIAEMLPDGAPNPFPVLCGTSAGAINAAAIAVYAQRFHTGVRRLNYVWRNFRVNLVYRSDALGILQTGLHWVATLLLGGLGKRNPTALLDRAPLRALIEQTIPCDEIQKSIDAGALRALSITCSGYNSGQSVTFFQGVDSLVAWKRARRIGAAARITVDHLLASSAIPFVFAAVPINREYFGDGSMRQEAPVSPALHLGAERVLVIGVRHDAPAPARDVDAEYPTLAQIAGHVLNSIFLDALEADVELLQRINKTISLIPEPQLREGNVTLRPVDVLVISPSQDLERIAAQYLDYLPRPVRYLFRGLGAMKRGGANLVSYLLFERPYTRALIGLGYADAMVRRKEIMEFLGTEQN
jgi:NTE family protein